MCISTQEWPLTPLDTYISFSKIADHDLEG